MKFGISFDNAPMMYVGDAGQLASGLLEMAASTLKRDQFSLMEHGGVWKFEAQDAENFLSLHNMNPIRMGSRESATFHTAIASVLLQSAKYVRFSFFKDELLLAHLQDALEQTTRDCVNAHEEHMRLTNAANAANERRNVASRHNARLKTQIAELKGGAK